VVYRSRYRAVNILHCRWYDSDVGRVPADVGEGRAGAAAAAVGSIATSEEAESPRFAGVRRRDEMTLSPALRSRRSPCGDDLVLRV